MPAMPSLNSLRAVLFDWDGTLVDSAALTHRCYAKVFGHFQIPFDQDAFRRTYSPDWYRTYVAMGLPKASWPEADRLWLDLYARERSELMPGARGILELLESRDLALGLVTSGDRERVAEELHTLGVARFFCTVLCRGDAPERKPHPAGLLLALDRMNVPARSAAYVGDSPEDIQMSRAAEVFSVGIPGGFPNEAELRAAAPDLWAANLSEAAATLTKGV
jgi:phosphoglycolate phosphatase